MTTYVIALLVVYVLIGALIAEHVRRYRGESMREFWRGHFFGNVMMWCLWPLPVFAAIAAHIHEESKAPVAFRCPRCGRITVGGPCRCGAA